MLLDRLIYHYSPDKKKKYKKYRNYLYFGFMSMSFVTALIPFYAGFRFGLLPFFMFTAFFGFSFWAYQYAQRSKKELDELLKD